MWSAKAATTISKTNKKQTEGHLFNERVGDRALSYDSAKTATCKYSFKNSAINGRAKGSRKKITCRLVDGERRKMMNILNFQLSTILFYKNYKNKL